MTGGGTDADAASCAQAGDERGARTAAIAVPARRTERMFRVMVDETGETCDGLPHSRENTDEPKEQAVEPTEYDPAPPRRTAANSMS